MVQWQEFVREDVQNQLVSRLKLRGRNLLAMMMEADQIREEQVGDTVTFIRNQNINFSNICYVGCKFCAFAAHEGSDHAYRMDEKELVEQARNAHLRQVSEICSTAGIDPKSDLEYYRYVLRTFSEFAPNVHIHAFSPFEIHYLAQKEEESYDTIIQELKNAGLKTLCGTAAEILVPRVREIICPNKLTVDEWIEIIMTAHSSGLKSTATIMYGHVETVEEIATHLQIIRGIQEETGGFTEFIPLPFIHQKTRLYQTGKARAGSTGMEDLALLAASRIYMGDVIPNLQSSWVKTGMKFATFALTAGVNDIGGTLFEERISRFAGASHGVYQPEEEFIRFILDAERIPARRDTLYNILETFKELPQRDVVLLT
ncbi:MAG: 7,8-didemethyl-8-hydroxy-5-deazariboflavin synthase subunit CofH [Methanobacteriota archaeon]|nr:MAG: 7,8-didemethyl-8-hydroxy-5-deazariboflavin synthase subunit CofH [Euryarchaeota archaeon]